MKPQGFVFDVESDGFYMESTVLWCVVLKDINNPDNSLKVLPFEDLFAKQKILEYVNQFDNPIITGHFMLGFDIFMLMKYLGIEFTVGKDTFNSKPCTYIDTFYLSMYEEADREGHSIEYFGEILGLEKIDWRKKAIELGLITAQSPKGSEFKQWHPEMGVYCERDCDVNIKVFWYLFNKFTSIYGSFTGVLPDHFRCSQKSFFLMSCQEYTGWQFDFDYAKDLTPKIEAMMKDIEDNVLPKLPPRKLKKGEMKEYSMPAKPFKKDGSFSSHMLNFIEKHKGEVTCEFSNTIKFYDKEYVIEPQKLLDIKLPMEIKDSEDLKEWFMSQGWKPSLWNFKRGKDGKPERDKKGKLIQTSPKLQEAGKLCPNLERLDGEIPKQIVKYLSLRNRLSVLTGWMENWRLEFDGRIGASRTGITPTHRQKHSVVVNLPKGSEKILLGKEFRSLYIVEKGNVLVSVDQSGLEARVMGHYSYRYDNGLTADELLNGDPHSKNAFAFYEEELQALGITPDNFSKDDPRFKPFRDRSKNGFYALLYGCSAAKLASTLGLPESRGDFLLEKFWNANPATKALKDNVTAYWEKNGNKKYLPGIDGRQLCTRKKSALLNMLFQSCGAISMDYAICFVDQKLGGIKFDEKFRPYYSYKGYKTKRVGYMHDQLDFESNPEIANDIKDIIDECYVKAGQHLKLKVPLQGDGKIGRNLYEVH